MSRTSVRVSRPLTRRLPSLDALVGVALLALLATFCTFLCLRALGVIGPGELIPATILETWLAGLPLWAKLSVAGGSLAVGLLSLWALIARITPGRSLSGDDPPLVLDHDERGIVVVDGECVVDVAEHAAAATPGVWDARVTVRPRGPKTVDLTLNISMLEGADLKRGATMARDRAIDAIDRLVGLEVRHTGVRVDLVEPTELTRRYRGR